MMDLLFWAPDRWDRCRVGWILGLWQLRRGHRIDCYCVCLCFQVNGTCLMNGLLNGSTISIKGKIKGERCHVMMSLHNVCVMDSSSCGSKLKWIMGRSLDSKGH